MSKHHFTFKEVFTFGWTKTVQHAWFVFLTFIIISIIGTATILNPIINAIVTLMATLSIAAVSLMIVRNHAFSFSDLYNPLLSPRRVLRFFALASFYVLPMLLVMLMGAILFVGAANGSASVTLFGLITTLLLFVPSVFIAVRFNFFPYIVAEHEHSSVRDLIMMSYKLTEGNFWKIFFFIVLAGILNAFGALLFGVGLFLTIPITVFACAHLYDRLKSHSM